jgi:hypothetical protein
MSDGKYKDFDQEATVRWEYNVPGSTEDERSEAPGRPPAPERLDLLIQKIEPGLGPAYWADLDDEIRLLKKHHRPDRPTLILLKLLDSLLHYVQRKGDGTPAEVLDLVRKVNAGVQRIMSEGESEPGAAEAELKKRLRDFYALKKKLSPGSGAAGGRVSMGGETWPVASEATAPAWPPDASDRDRAYLAALAELKKVVATEMSLIRTELALWRQSR